MIVCLPYEANFLYFCRMKTSMIYRLFLIGLFAVSLSVTAKASHPIAKRGISDIVFTLDTVPSKKPAADTRKEPEKKKPEIKEVPKSRRQIKPKAVGERIKGKPPVRVKPKIIKKPVKNIKRAIGRIK